jgi:hypothetical protein
MTTEALARIPGGCLPAILWSALPPRTLQLVNGELTWLTGNIMGPTFLWSVSAKDVGRVPPRLLTSFLVRNVEEVWEDGTVYRDQDCDTPRLLLHHEDLWFFDRRDGIGVVPRAGGPAADHAELGCDPDTDCPRTVQCIRWWDGALHVAGVTELYAPAEGSLTTLAAPFLARVKPDGSIAWLHTPAGSPTPLFDHASVTMIEANGALLVCWNGRIWRHRGGVTTELPRPAIPIHRMAAGSTGVFGAVDYERLVRLDPDTGAVLGTLLDPMPGVLQSLIEVGQWLCIATYSEGRSSDLLAVRPDGSDPRVILRVDDPSEIHLCADDQFLYWTDDRAHAICRTPLGGDGAPLPVTVENVPEPVTVRRASRRASRDQSRSIITVAPVSDYDLAMLLDTLAGVTGTASPRSDQGGPVPWIGWLFVVIARYRARMTAAFHAIADRSMERGKHRIDDANWRSYDVADDHVWVWGANPGDESVYLRCADAGDRLHVVIDPDWVSAFSFSYWVGKQRSALQPAEQRLWRWLPGERLIAEAASFYTQRFGGAADRNWPRQWFRLPPALDAVVPALNRREIDLTSSRVASWVGDVEIAAPGDHRTIDVVRRAHAEFVDDLIDDGVLSVADAVPALRSGGALTEACDRLMEALRYDSHGVEQVIQVLQAHPAAPPSRFLRWIAAVVTPPVQGDLFELAASYLLERGLDIVRVRSKLRWFTGLDLLVPPGVQSAGSCLEVRLLLPALLHEPEAGLRILRRSLGNEFEWPVTTAAALLVVLRRPWCVFELRAANTSAKHTEIISAALARLGGARPIPLRDLDAAIERWRDQVQALSRAHRQQLADAPALAGNGTLPLDVDKKGTIVAGPH